MGRMVYTLHRDQFLAVKKAVALARNELLSKDLQFSSVTASLLDAFDILAEVEQNGGEMRK